MVDIDKILAMSEAKKFNDIKKIVEHIETLSWDGYNPNMEKEKAHYFELVSSVVRGVCSSDRAKEINKILER
jgi:hypothetical protein